MPGLQEESNEVLESKVSNLFRDMGHDEMRYINRMQRVGKRDKEGRPRQVIVQFSHHSLEESIVKSKRDLHTNIPRSLLMRT